MRISHNCTWWNSSGHIKHERLHFRQIYCISVAGSIIEKTDTPTNLEQKDAIPTRDTFYISLKYPLESEASCVHDQPSIQVSCFRFDDMKSSLPGTSSSITTIVKCLRCGGMGQFSLTWRQGSGANANLRICQLFQKLLKRPLICGLLFPINIG